MSNELFIVRKIAFSARGSFSSFIIRMAVAAVALSVATIIITTSLVTGFQHQIRSKILGFGGHIIIRPFSLSQSLEEEGVSVQQDFYRNKNVLPKVAHIQVMALQGGLLKTDDDFEGIVLKGVGADFSWQRFAPYLRSGDSIRAGTEDSRKDILISSQTAKRLHLKLGDKVIVAFMGNNIRNRPFRVKGIYETGMEEFDKRYAMCDIAIIQQLNNWGADTVGGFEIFLSEENLFKSRAQAYYAAIFGRFHTEEERMKLNADPIDEIADEIYFSLKNNKLDAQCIKYIYPGIFDWLELQNMNELIILFMMVVIAVINMITALLILILDRTNMIGILKALGSSNGSVRKLFLLYSTVIVCVGLLLGNVIGIGLCLAQQHFHLIKLPSESYYISEAPILFSWGMIAVMNVGTVIVCVLTLLIPSYLITKITPLRAIRFA